MTTAANENHRTFSNPALPFVTNSSPLSADPQYIGGANALGSIIGKLERRAGFSLPLDGAGLAVPAGETIKNIFQWRKWNGAFVTMVSTVTASSAKVYAYRAGVDATLSLIYTANATDGKFFSFCVANNTCFMGNGNVNDMRAYDALSLTTRKWGIAAPAAAPAVTTGTGGSVFNVVAGYFYVYTYGSSSTGHESSPSLLSTCISPSTGVNGQVSVLASTDPQVNQIRVYRTTDGGSFDPPDMREITGSPFSNTSQTITDATADTSLGARTAPEFSRNDPPPGMEGIIYASNASRICGFAGDTMYYSGFEEIQNGVPYECFPSGLDGNNYPFGTEVTALGEMPDGIAIFTAESIQKVEGDSLDTFRRYTLARRQGTRSSRCVATLGDLMLWIDSVTSSVWMLGGTELGKDIRPSLSGIDFTQAQVAVHIYGTRRWFLVLDGANQRIYPFDIDMNQWHVPWTVAATAIHSGETSLGVFSLLAGLSTNRKVMMQVEGTFNDAGTPYAMSVQSGMQDIAPAAKPDLRAKVDFVDIKRNADAGGGLSGMGVLTDDDPTQGTYLSIFVNKEDQPTVPQGTYIKQERFTAAGASIPPIPVCRMASVTMAWPALDEKSELYYWDIGMSVFGG